LRMLSNENAAVSHFRQLVSVTHFWAGRIGPFHHQFNADEFMAMRALSADRVFVQIFKVRFLRPH